jgi:hypothetical protein
MATHPLWSDEYWLLLLQIYLKKPTGVKPTYSKSVVSLSLELHIPPQYLHQQMSHLDNKESPVLQLLWKTYSKNPRKLTHDIKKLRSLEGFGHPQEFYDGVETNESFEKNFLPIDQRPELMPVSLIMILDLYFRLTPITMVDDTPEIQELAKLLKIKPHTVTEVMEVFQYCDPYLNRDELMISPLLLPCQNTWNHYGNDDPKKLSELATELSTYFLS